MFIDKSTLNSLDGHKTIEGGGEDEKEESLMKFP
jgi:hypothetical protein